MNKLIMPAKKALAEKYGYKNVSVKNGRGTAWGWVEVSINTKRPFECLGDTNGFWCNNCRKGNNFVSNEARETMDKAWKSLGLKPYTYSSDDNYSSDREEVLVSVNYI